MYPSLTYAGLALGALFWIWRRAKRRRREEKEKNRRANLPRLSDGTTSRSRVVTNAQNIELHVRQWNAPAARGVVLVIHSFAWHSGCFEETANALKQRQFSVVAYDLQGHGRSGSEEKTRGDLRRFEHLVSDSEKIIDFARMAFPNRPLFLLGDGFGATIAIHAALRSDRKLDGLILCGPYVMPHLDQHPPSHVTPVLQALEKLMPDVRIATVDPAKAAWSEGRDPLLLHSPTLRFLVNSHRSLLRLEKRVQNLKSPFVTLHGACDPRASPDHSRELFSRAKSQDKTLMIYDHMHNCLFEELEEDRSHVITDILAWLDARTNISAQRIMSERRPVSEIPNPASTSTVNFRQHRLLSLMSRNGF